MKLIQNPSEVLESLVLLVDRAQKQNPSIDPIILENALYRSFAKNTGIDLSDILEVIPDQKYWTEDEIINEYSVDWGAIYNATDELGFTEIDFNTPNNQLVLTSKGREYCHDTGSSWMWSDQAVKMMLEFWEE